VAPLDATEACALRAIAEFRKDGYADADIEAAVSSPNSGNDEALVRDMGRLGIYVDAKRLRERILELLRH
jgi:hypothetical protein